MFCNIIVPLILISIFLPKFIFAARIESKSINVREVQTVYVVPGKPLLIDFPCDVRFALPGTKADLEIKIGLEKKNNITFWAHSMSDVMGVNVKCGNDIIVYDVIPHKKKYQNFIKINKIVNQSKSNKRVLIGTSEGSTLNVNKSGNHKRKLISTGTLFKTAGGN